MANDQKASLGFKRGNADKKVTFGNNVTNKFKAAPDNPLIPKLENMPIPLETLMATNDKLTGDAQRAMKGSSADKEILKATLRVWNAQYTVTANYVTTLSGGSAAIITLLGFVPTKAGRTRKVKPGKVINFEATINGKRRTIVAQSTKPLPGTLAFGYVAAPDDAGIVFNDNTVVVTVGGKSVYFMVCTQRKAEFYNMPGQQRFNVCMFGVNAAGSGPASDLQDVTPQ